SDAADTSAIGFNGLVEFSADLLKLVAELAQQASFPEDEFERERRQMIEGLRIARTTPSFLANERMRRVLFGAHPYAIIAPTETQVLVANHAITRKHPDWLRLALANSIYGGAFNSRLVMNIREQKGYTYSPRSGVHALRQHGYFSVNAAVRNDVVAATLTEIFYELDKLRSVPVPETELADARNYLSGVFSMGLATQDGLLTQFSTVA